MTDSIDAFFVEWAVQMEEAGLPGIPADAQFIYRISRMCKLLGDRLDASCARHDLTRSQFEAMAVMRRRHPQPLGAGDLMKAAFLTSGSVTAMLNQLLDKGLVQRQTHKQDKRRIEVQLTAAGRAKIEAAIRDRIQDNVAMAHTLPEQDRAGINLLMRRFLATIESMQELPE